jgi:hypothetical protein
MKSGGLEAWKTMKRNTRRNDWGWGQDGITYIELSAQAGPLHMLWWRLQRDNLPDGERVHLTDSRCVIRPGPAVHPARTERSVLGARA